jgi:DNA-binding CsgD family transcriptional regulator
MPIRGYLPIPMEDRVARLSEGQRECLRMVYRHMETKEIARILGISPDGVAQRIKTAMRILGVHRRRDAARLLAEAEGAPPAYPPLVNPSWDIAQTPQPMTFDPSIAGMRHESGFSGRVMMEEQVAFQAAAPARPRKLQLQVPLPFRGSRPNDLSLVRRLVWIIAIMLVIALVFGMFLAGLESLSRMGQAARP